MSDSQVNKKRARLSLAVSAGILACLVAGCTETDPYSEAYFSILNDTDAGVYLVIIPDAGDTTDMSTLEAALAPGETVVAGSVKGIGYSPPQWNIEVYESADKDVVIITADVPDLSDRAAWHTYGAVGQKEYQVYWELLLSAIIPDAQ